MSKLKRLIVSVALCLGSLALAAPSYATVLLVGSGWQLDSVDAPNMPSGSSPVTFTVAPGTTDTFSLTDCCIAGDIYKVTIDGLISVISTFTTYSTTFDNNLGPAASFAAPDWLDTSLSHIQITFAPGTYSLSITGNGAGGFPAGFADRLDGVPEPATWLAMLVGFGGLGTAMRGKRRRRASLTV